MLKEVVPNDWFAGIGAHRFVTPFILGYVIHITAGNCAEVHLCISYKIVFIGSKYPLGVKVLFDLKFYQMTGLQVSARTSS